MVAIGDADCRLGDAALGILASACTASGRSVPGRYPEPACNVSARVTKNRVRPRGLARMGLPCRLFGAGMAFPLLGA